jgi:pyruvate kinase
MIARGDLAVECGYQRLAEVQEEILWVCEAVHMPVIWATQVLEPLAKSGIPSPAEITDAATGERAECVILNKGPYIVTAVGSSATSCGVCGRTTRKKNRCCGNFNWPSHFTLARDRSKPCSRVAQGATT